MLNKVDTFMRLRKDESYLKQDTIYFTLYQMIQIIVCRLYNDFDGYCIGIDKNILREIILTSHNLLSLNIKFKEAQLHNTGIKTICLRIMII